MIPYYTDLLGAHHNPVSSNNISLQVKAQCFCLIIILLPIDPEDRQLQFPVSLHVFHVKHTLMSVALQQSQHFN